MIRDLLSSNYHIFASSIQQMTTGAGGTTYKVIADNGAYIAKLTKEDAINHPRIEPFVCRLLRKHGINTMSFLQNTDQSYSTEFQGKILNVYEFIPGQVVKYHTLENSQVDECARILARIHLALRDMDLPAGLSQGFFSYMTPDRARNSYLQSLRKAEETNESNIALSIQLRMELLDCVQNWNFDSSKLTYRNSHGDFTSNQIILNDQIYVIDFTACCKQPVIWELTRFFFHADKTAKDGKLDPRRFYDYLKAYTERIPLNKYDKENLFKLYFYQLLVCDYYGQYFNETDPVKKKDYFDQANFASKILSANKELIQTIS